MDLMIFKTKEEVEAFIASKKEGVSSGAETFQVEEGFVIKRKINDSDEYEYLMEDGSFKNPGKESLIYDEFDLSIHVVPPPEEEEEEVWFCPDCKIEKPKNPNDPNDPFPQNCPRCGKLMIKRKR
jgi:hypothetical protein